MNEAIQLKTETERTLFDELSRLQKKYFDLKNRYDEIDCNECSIKHMKEVTKLSQEISLLKEENEYIRRTMKHELLSWIPVVVSHLYKNDNKFDSTIYNQALDDGKREIERWLK